MSGVGGHLYPGKPAAAGTGPTIHLVVDDVDAAAGRVKDAGGQVVSPVISIPAGRFAYCLDLDGNSFGVFSA
jgi:predicted enzyme related to lactoylglutathione lyase